MKSQGYLYLRLAKRANTNLFIAHFPMLLIECIINGITLTSHHGIIVFNNSSHYLHKVYTIIEFCVNEHRPMMRNEWNEYYQFDPYAHI